MTKKQIQFKLNTSRFVIDRINRTLLSKFSKLNVRDIIKLSEENKERLKKAIIEYKCRTKYTITEKDVAHHINSKLNTEYSVRFIRNFKKNQANLVLKGEFKA